MSSLLINSTVEKIEQIEKMDPVTIMFKCIMFIYIYRLVDFSINPGSDLHNNGVDSNITHMYVMFFTVLLMSSEQRIQKLYLFLSMITPYIRYM